MSITAITVVYNTKDLLERSVYSFRKWYDHRLIVVNGSDPGSECDIYCKTDLQQYRGIHVYNIGHNIGHGDGMHYAMERCTTKHALVFDSDIYMNKHGVVEGMMAKMADDVYGVGLICQADEHGRNVEKGIPYMHPYFMLLNVKEYFKWPRFVHHGAPCYQTMNALHRAGKSDMLIDFPVADYVDHEWRGTRKINPPEFLRGWR